MKRCTHIEDIQMKKRTEAFLLLLQKLLHFNHFLCEKHKKNSTKFQILLNNKISECLRNFLLYVFRILFNNDPQQISFNSAKKWLRKWYRNTTFSSKMHNGENAFEVLLYLLYINNASIAPKDAFSV